MKTKVFIEISTYGFSAYTEANKLDYSCIGEGKTVQEAIADFNDSYEEIKSYYLQEGLPFQEASFLSEYCKAFSLAGLERITGISQAQLGHFLHGRRKPSQKTIHKIQEGVERFAGELTALKFA